ncbi:ROT1 protein [Ephemerocybe angulata]|uniref:Protein ROT1 n=1 Tax=Ephemerocybe angulata TaxID=980116 RepID=A0A8H6HZG7_9AGAR|nr:ROT1 protein [Tulosesus angulatus]
MILTSLLTVVLASLAQLTVAQVDDTQGPILYDLAHNATVITGTWTSGSKAVVTGEGFCDPVKLTFTYPKNTGVSFSFSGDGHYEIARYRFNGNGSDPTCITGVIGWVHGTYTLNTNGSIWMKPFGDGFQQIQDPCAAVSNFIETYNETEYYKGWRIFSDPNDGPKLHLYQFDGSPVAPLFQVSTTPSMFPTKLLRNDTFISVSRRSLEEEEEDLARRDSSATVDRRLSISGVLGAAGLLTAAGVSMML